MERKGEKKGKQRREELFMKRGGKVSDKERGNGER